jgi:hypothetical protein
LGAVGCNDGLAGIEPVFGRPLELVQLFQLRALEAFNRSSAGVTTCFPRAEKTWPVGGTEA